MPKIRVQRTGFQRRAQGGVSCRFVTRRSVTSQSQRRNNACAGGERGHSRRHADDAQSALLFGRSVAGHKVEPKAAIGREIRAESEAEQPHLGVAAHRDLEQRAAAAVDEVDPGDAAGLVRDEGDAVAGGCPVGDGPVDELEVGDLREVFCDHDRSHERLVDGDGEHGDERGGEGGVTALPTRDMAGEQDGGAGEEERSFRVSHHQRRAAIAASIAPAASAMVRKKKASTAIVAASRNSTIRCSQFCPFVEKNKTRGL